ncbi:uncharacterized protein KIAA0754 homolog [Rattus norvegicus]|uniref:uncharacterized protein KIAA0754 homolog n=1 Tax=Rattus norvegicus TaxID=10116 RepID=UPI000442D018|nr:uncharacterized protein KIAA0754 homolog [Rattus norvegicus]|eukprot:NP_001278312.1 uncharacterized protein KIAA0754 homolog [Rattus norvegicus]
MGKPLSRPDCLRRNPTCLGKGEDEDGYIEDCYVPQRSIYDTMRINEQIDQGSKLNQTSKSTMEKMDGSTLSSNGTLGASSNVFESRVPEGKKLDERIIFDALKLSSDVQKSAPVPPRRRPNAERKDNVNRRSWKSFMPPNFPEFAERMEASLSEVSEAGASNPSLHEKKESSSALTESSGQFDHREPQSESVTLEHMSKSVDIPEVQNVKNLRDCQDFRFQQHSESSPHEFQPLDSEAAAASGNTDEMQDHRFSSATWPRAMKSSSKGGLGEKQHPLGDTACTVELPPLSPCLSEELLDPELHILITPSLREKTESELKFEEDERWIMMEAEEEWEEEKLSEKRKSLVVTNEETSMADPFEESDQANTVAAVEDGSDCVAVLALHQMCCSVDLQPTGDQPASVPEGTPPDCTCVPTGEDVSSEMKNRPAQGLEGLISGLQCPVEADQLSDTDSVQMFLELEKECLCEEGVTSSAELLSQASFEGLAPTQDAEDSLLICHSPGAALEQEQHVGFLSVRVKDPDTGLDGEHCNALESSQVSQAVELSAHPDSRRDTSTVSKECEKVPFSPKTGGKFKPLADLEPLGELDTGGLLNSNLSGSCEESLPVFIASEPAKENGNLSQVDCSQTEGNVEEYMERIPLSFAFNYEQDVTSGPEVEVLSSDSNLLTDEIQLESEKGAIISQEDNNLASLENIDPYELSTEKVCDKDGETKEPDCQGKLLGNGAPAHFLTDFQRRSSESEVLNLQLLAGELRLNKAGAETVSDKETQLSVTLSQEGEVEMRGLDSTLNIFPDEQITKASNTVPGSEEWISSQQMPAPAAVVPMAEDALDAVVPMPGEDIPAVALPALEGPAAKASASEVTAVATPIVPIQKEDIPVASVVILMEDVTAAAISASEQTAASSGTVPPVETVTVPIIDEDVTSEEPDTQAAEVFLPEESAIPAPTGPTSEEPDTPTVTVSTAEEPDTRAGSTPEECTVPALEETIPEKSDTQVVSMSIPEWSATPATSVPAKEIFSPGGPFLEGTTHTDSVSIAEETPVLENASSPGMWIKEGFDSSAFGIKEVPGTMLHGKVPLAATDGLNSHEVTVAHFTGRKSLERSENCKFSHLVLASGGIGLPSYLLLILCPWAC